MTINELRLAIADTKSDLEDLMAVQSVADLHAEAVRRRLYHLQMELQYRLAGNSMQTYCDQNPGALECRIYDV